MIHIILMQLATATVPLLNNKEINSEEEEESYIIMY
jgi:hypothetical protein